METKKNLTAIMPLLSQSWEVYTSRFSLWRWFIICEIIFLGLQDLISSPLDFNKSGSTALFSLIFFAGTILSSWLMVGMILGTVNDENFGSLMKRAVPKLGLYFRQMILVFLIEMGAFSLFVIPGLFLSVSLCVAGVVLVLENTGSFEAILKSREYIRGYWWQIFWRTSVLWVPTTLMLVIYLAVGTQFELIFKALQIAMSAFLFPLETIYLVKIYQELKKNKSEAKTVSRRFKFLIWLSLILGLVAIGFFLLISLVSR